MVKVGEFIEITSGPYSTEGYIAGCVVEVGWEHNDMRPISLQLDPESDAVRVFHLKENEYEVV